MPEERRPTRDTRKAGEGMDYFSDCYGEDTPPSPYPIYPRMGAPRDQVNPLTLGNEEFYPQEFERYGLAHASPMLQRYQAVELQYGAANPAIHRIEGQTLDPGRTLTNPGRFVAPQLAFGTMEEWHFGNPADIEDSEPSPEVQRSYGQYTAAPHDMLHTIPKQLPDYDYQALSQTDMADRARLALRKALYGQ